MLYVVEISRVHTVEMLPLLQTLEECHKINFLARHKISQSNPDLQVEKQNDKCLDHFTDYLSHFSKVDMMSI